MDYGHGIQCDLHEPLDLSYPRLYSARGHGPETDGAFDPQLHCLGNAGPAEELAVEATEGRDLKRSRTVELGFLRKDGSTFWGEVNATFIRDPEGKAVGILGVSRDINDRRRAEEALRESQKEAQRNAKEASAMAEIGRIMSSTLTIEEVYESFVAAAGKIIPFDRIVINMIDRENRTLRIVYISGGEVSDRKIGAVYSLEGSENAEMLRTKSTFLLQTEGFEKYKDRYPVLWSTFQAGFRSFLNVPLFSRGEIIGGLLLRSYKPHAYADEDVRLAERIANQIAGAIANAQLFVKEKQTQEALREAERKYRELVRYAPAGIYEGDFRTGRFISVNDALCEMIGYSREELLEMKALDILDEESQGRYRHRMAQWLDGKEPERQVEYRVKTKDGRTRDGVFNVTFKTDENGKPLSAAVVAHDITERKQMENALRESEERFRQVAENVGDFIWEIDAEGLYRYTSISVERILGYKPEELVGKKRYYELFVPEVREELKEAAFKVLAAKESFRDFSNPNLSKEGKVVHLETSGVPVLDAAGNLVGYRGAATDVTERKEAEEALRKAHEELQQEMAKREKAEQQLLQSQKLEAIGTLTGGIAHDFNNILATIVINSEMALFDLPGGSGLRTNLDLILKSGLRGKDLVKQMLLFSRKSEKKQEVLTLTPLIKETFKLLRSSIPTTIQMKLHLETESDSVSADPSQIQQVIMNLCTNAAYAMRGTTGSIDISLRGITFGSTDLPEAEMQPGDYLVLSVKDTGSGMDEEVKERIFEPFFTTKPVGEGTGLGLSVVYGIVKNHKGGITVYSEPGKGSVFKVYFPKVDTGVSVEAETSKPIPIPRGNERILLLDDEEFIVKAVQNMLEHLGYKVTALMDNREALKLFSADPSQFDLVITDQTMPFMTGEDLGKELMRIRPDIPVILCTGYSDLISSEKAIAMGFRGFIMKPFTVREGAELVRRVLDQKDPGNLKISTGKADNTQDMAALTPADLSVLPAEWLKEFFQTMEKGRSTQLLNLIDQIRPEHADLARALAEMVRIHQYEKLIPLTREALKGKTDG